MGIYDDSKLPKRVVRVNFWRNTMLDASGKYVKAQPELISSFDNLEARFNITKYRGGMIDKADIDVLNLNADMRNTIVTLAKDNFSLGNKGFKQHRYGISIDAGYEGQNVGKIYAGDIYQALPVSTSPEIALKIECRTGFLTKSIWVERLMLKACDFRTLCAQAAAALNLTLRYESDENKSIDGFVFTGVSYNLVSKIQALDSRVIIKCDDIFFHVKNNLPKGRENAITISQANGMISIPKPQQFGTNVATLLNPFLDAGDWVNVNSKLIPQYNGLYNISILTHSGSLRGNTFETKLQCTTNSGLQER